MMGGRRETGDWRHRAASELLARAVEKEAVGGRALLVDDRIGLAAQALSSRTDLHRWDRCAWSGQPATPWAPDGTFDTVAVRLPRGREGQDLALHVTASRIGPEGLGLICGANDEGIKSLAKRAGRLFRDVRTVDAARHCRVLAVGDPVDGARGAISDWEQSYEASVGGRSWRWRSIPGVFAHGRLDDGTSLLVDHLPALAEDARVLDFGCGVGVLPYAILSRTPTARVSMLDVDATALHCAALNVPNAVPCLSDGWSNLESSKFDLIVSNPPLHAGKGHDHRALFALVDGARRYLAADGELRMVVQRAVPMAKILDDRFIRVAVEARDQRYCVWRVRRPR